MVYSITSSHLSSSLFQGDPGGIMYHRHVPVEDHLLDLWHPWEKGAFIDYFELREKRKDEFEKYYDNVIVKKGIVDPAKLEFPAPAK